MRIWIESPFDNLPQEGFRRQRYWLMAEAFVRAGHVVHYWTMNFNHGTKAKRVFKEGELLPIELHTIDVPSYRKNVSLRRALSHFVYARRLKKAAIALAQKKKPDLIIAATPTLGAANVMAKIAKRWDAKFVLDIQDAWPETFARLLPRPVRFLAKILLFPMYRTARRLYRTADFVTGVSARYRKLVRRDDYYLAYHGVLSSPFLSTTTPPNYNFSSLFYLGNLGSGYNLDPVLAAMVYNPEWTLEIAGRGPQEARLKRLVKTLGLEDRVRFHGYLDSAALQALMKTCAVGIIPMRDDSWVGLPYKLGDYLSAGLFVLSSLHGECGDLLESHHLGATYEYDSYQSFIAAWESLRNLPLEQRSLPDILRADLIYPNYMKKTRMMTAATDCFYHVPA